MTIALGGVVPAASTAPSRNGTGRSVRAVLPNSASFRITVEGDDFSRTSEEDASGSELSISGLPAGEELSITVESLDGNGDPVTSWTGNRTLAKGDNALSAVLVPAAASVAAITVADDNVFAIDEPTIAAGDSAFYRLTFHPTISGERQLLFDTGKARWVWIGVYDDQWNPIVPAAGDQSQGWVVLDTDTVRTVNVAVANAVSSPGYPAGSIACTLQARPAVFFAPGATGAGTSSSPAGFDGPALDREGCSFFFRGGTYGIVNAMNDAIADQRLYGGFSASSWNSRTGTTVIEGMSGTSSTLQYLLGVSGTLDGLTVNARSGEEVYNASGLVLLATSSGYFVINDCAISGPSSGYGTSSIASYAAQVAGNVELAGSSILGGTLSSSEGTPTAVGLYIGSPSSVYVHGSVLSGGNSTCYGSGLGSESHAVFSDTTSATLVIAGCEIWGGVASSNGSDTLTNGIRWPSPNLIVANSRVSGGYSNSSGGNATTEAIYHAYTGTSAILLAGNTIDAGYSSSENKYSFGLYYSVSGGGGQAMGNAFFVSDFDSSLETETGIMFVTPGGLPSVLSYNVAFNSSGSGTFDGTDYVTTDDFSSAGAIDYMNDTDWQRTPEEEFVSYSAPTSLATFLAQDWRPRSGALFAGISGTSSPFSGDDLDSYPALAFDLAGVARPATWARGAYER